MLVASMTLLRLRLNAIATKWRALIAGNAYRPELYYMRGRGPKWHAKHRLLARLPVPSL